MKALVKKIRDFLHQTAGPTAVEYAVLLVLIVFGALTAISLLGVNLNNTIISTANALPSGTSGGDSSASSQGGEGENEDAESGKGNGGKGNGGKGNGGKGNGGRGYGGR